MAVFLPPDQPFFLDVARKEALERQQGQLNQQNIRKQQILNNLLPQLERARIQQAQGPVAQTVGGVLDFAKQRNLNPQQTRQLLNLAAGKLTPRKGIQVGVGPGGQLTGLSIGGPAQAGAGADLGSLFGGQIIPNTGGTSRGSQGAAKVNPDGTITSVPTRQTAGFLQQGAVGNQKLQAALNVFQKGMRHYVGPAGHMALLRDAALARVPFGLAGGFTKRAENRLEDYSKAIALKEAIAQDAERMSAGRVSDTGTKGWRQAINPSIFDTPGQFDATMGSLRSMGNTFSGIGQKGLVNGIPSGQLTPDQINLINQSRQAAVSQDTPLAQSFYPHEAAQLHTEAMTPPQNLVNGIPHIKQNLPKIDMSKHQVFRGSDGRLYTKEQLEQIAQSGGNR